MPSKNSVIYLTQNLPGIGGRIKSQPEDFIVDEIPSYLPSGEGTHTYFAMRKQNLTTMEAIRCIARALNVSPHAFGYAGLKDATAITTQLASIEHILPSDLSNLQLPNIEILWAKLHRNKLRLGHLKGNRFHVVVREVRESALSIAQQVLDCLEMRGVPNRFGEQRFGIRGNSHLIGRAFLRQDWKTAVDLYLGHPADHEMARLKEARQAYDAGQFQRSHDCFPLRTHGDERRLLKTLMRRSPDLQAAFLTIPKRLRNLFLSAYQANLFNRVLDARLPDLGVLYYGDLAMKHSNGAVFTVEDPVTEQPRADAFEISPSGPIYAPRMTFPIGKAQIIEEQVLAEENLTLSSFHAPSIIRLKGARRSLRVQIESSRVEEVDAGLRISFSLPAGAYATVVLDELMKSRPDT